MKGFKPFQWLNWLAIVLLAYTTALLVILIVIAIIQPIEGWKGGFAFGFIEAIQGAGQGAFLDPIAGISVGIFIASIMSGCAAILFAMKKQKEVLLKSAALIIVGVSLYFGSFPVILLAAIMAMLAFLGVQKQRAV